ncbi:hypothetical protein CTEN210_08296 [Chaetoceros tenuissimus]|uniref:Nuclear pore complex protein Nup153 n=1 Tax=Chaetoceros tenuissimus TaxID=426638 RepID=A0AAD3CVJ6_9STRA|nr:hypothetical protein CTEN210_08296 [Chaetoceros tenuissimus]
MDLSEALKFNSKECVKKSEVEPTLSRNRSGLTHSCASSNGTALFHYLPQTQTITLYQSSTNYTPLSQFHAKDVIHMSCSFDGRLLLLLHSDSSVTCIDVTSGGMTVRFTLQDVHSHSSVYGMHTVGKRLRANIHRGPVHSVTFNNTSGYDCLVVDAVKGIMLIDCQAGGIKRTISNQSLPSNILCADWDYNGEDGDLVAGFEDGSIALMHTQDDMEIIIPDAVEENDEEVNWSCTHIQSFPNHIAVGLCRVFDGEDENDNDISEEDLDEDDEASHEANLLIYSRESREWTELGDVVAFFAVPMFGRHVFYTTFLSKQNILLVGCNVTGEAGIVAETDGEWQVCELQEGDNATTPLTEDDEFTLPTGLSCVPDGSSHLNLVMSSTDGSLSVFDIEHIEDDKFAVSESVGPWAVTNATVEETVLQEEKNAAVETTREVEEIQGTDKDSNAETSVVEEAEQNQEKEGVTSAFGSGSSSGFSFGTSTATTPAFGSATSKPVFGSTTPFGSPSTSTPTSAPFGGAVFGSTSGLSSTTSSFGSPAFGLSSVKQGAFSLASKATQSESAPQLSEAEKNAPVFGSGSSAPVFGSGTTPAFGSGSSAPVFGSGTKPTFGTTSSGFGSLAQSSVNGFGALASTVTSESKEFGFNNTPRKQQSIFGMSTPIDKTKLDSSMIKPLFREQSPVKDGNLDRANPTKNTRDDIVDIVPSTAQAKHAEKAFDIIDQDKAQKVPTSKLDELVDEVGEGLHGDELDKQLAILDPDSTGYITRTSFIHWYCKLVEGSDDDDDGSLDTDEREEREEERNKATDAFDSVANAGIIHKSEFGDLMEAMGTTYCEEEHRRTLRKISDDDGNITQEAFVSWYMDWLFGDGDSDSDYSDEENDETDQQDSTAGAASSSSGWGSTFAVDKDSWKCESCMLRNKGSDVKCVACETVRPGHEDKVTAVDKKDTPSSSTGSGFTFSSANANTSAATGGGGSSGDFSFGFSGTPAPAQSSTTTTGGGSGGFSFGFSGTPAPAPATSSTDKKEGEAVPKSTTGFTFGLPASDKNEKPSADIVDIVPSTAQAKHAEKAFDIIDQDKAQKVPTSKLDELVDEVGEGLHGDELDKQLAILDPDSIGYITRTSFIHWYCKLVEGSDDDDDGSLDTDEREEREEERNKATDAFDSVANAGIIHKSEFGDLMEAMGTTYCEEEHRRTLRKISDDDGNITQEAFVSWYMDWLFGDGDSDSDYSDEENDETDQQDSTAGAASSSSGWGSTFAVDKDSWKCESCMLRNKGSDVKCVACETVRPGHEDKVTAVDKKDTPSSSTGSGFTFSSANANTSAATGGGGSSGDFSFGFSGTPAPAQSSTTTTGGGSGGFSFGFSGTPAPAPATSSTDKKEGEAVPKSTTGFSFTTSASKLTFGGNNQVSSSSSSAFPPMSAKAPTPFGSTNKTTTTTTANKPASSSAFPPMSAKAPTPFGGATASKPASSSAFPPMSAKAPTPFGATNKTTTTTANKSASSSAFPPMSAKAPTPFGGATASKAASSSAFPPMSAKAPTPFGATTKTTTTTANKPASSSAFPPMSAKAPTPFGGATASKAASSSAFPPMSAKAPTPFGTTNKTTTTTANKPASSSAFQPMSAKAPTPFGSTTKTAASTSKPALSSAFPPMSAKAPIPFGATIKTTTTTTANKPASSSAFPPMSAKAPTPFGATIKTTTTTTANKPALSSAFPPMSAKAPTPFGATTASKPASSSAFPPMSAKAPTPFGATTKTTTTTANKPALSSAFPPMSAKAPTPFGGATASKPASSSAFPPMSAKAPTPFGATTASKPASSSAFPPMSGKAPTPFGATTKTAASTSKPALSSAFPPMSAKAPTPFGATTKTAASTSKPASSSAFPPMSAKAPTPFGNNEGTNVSKSTMQSVISASRKMDYVPANEYESQFWRILSDYEKTLQDLKSVDCEQKIDTKGVNSMVQQIEKALGELSSLKSDVCSDNDFSLLLLSRSDDIERQIDASKKVISAHFDHDQKVSESDSVQSLDIESERNRRKILHKSLGIKNSINRLNDLIDLTSSMKKKTEVASKPNLFSWTPSRRTRKSSAPRGDRILVKQLMSGYERAKELERHVHSASRRLEEFSHVEAEKKKLSLSNAVVTKTKGGRSRITALPFSSPKSKSFAAPSQTCKVSKILAKDAMKLMQESFSINPKSFKVHSLSSSSNDQNQSTSSSWRTKSTSQMMKLGTHPASSGKSTSNFLLTSGENSASARSIWHQSDSAGMESVKLSLPSTLKQIDAAKAAKEALAPFGVTPDEMTTVKKALHRGDTLSVENQATKPTVKVAVKKGNKTAAFPPLSVKAPTPFGASNLVGTSKGPTSSSSTTATSTTKPLESSAKNKELKKTNSSAKFPPMSTKAPTPFGATTKQSADSKSENKAAVAFSLPKTDISLSKTTSNDQMKQKESTKSSLFGGFGGMGKALDIPSTKQDLFGSTTKKGDDSVDYLTIMTKFYQQHNPSKVGEVPKTLQKYQGREKELFEKLAKKYNVPNPLNEKKAEQTAPPPPTFGSTSQTTQISTSSGSSPDYKAILTKFYQTHNPSKISEVEKNLVKYQGREREMFAKLALKYKVPDPLSEESGTSPFGGAQASTGFGASNTSSGFGAISSSSPFGSTPQKASSSNVSPFGNSGNSSTPFGGVGSSAIKPSASPFGQSSGFAPSPSPFGQQAPSPSPFGQSAAPSPFGQTLAQTSTPFGQQASSQKLFGGKTAREHLTLFYQQKNPSKIGDVDKLLAKYAGKEEQLLANLAKKYNISPATFGLGGAPVAAPAFGSPSAMGGGNAFGQTSPMGGGGGFGSPSPAPSSGFGSFGAAAQAPSQGFGGFGAAPASGGFGTAAQAPSGFGATAPASGGFGSSSGFGAATPFGSARR